MAKTSGDTAEVGGARSTDNSVSMNDEDTPDLENSDVREEEEEEDSLDFGIGVLDPPTQKNKMRNKQQETTTKKTTAEKAEDDILLADLLVTPKKTKKTRNADEQLLVDEEEAVDETQAARFGPTDIDEGDAGSIHQAPITGGGAALISPSPRNGKAKKTKTKQPRIKTGSRIRIKKIRLFHAIREQEKREEFRSLSSEWPHNAWIYGTIKSGSQGKGWLIEFDFIGRVLIKDRKAFTAVQKGTEEPRLPPKAVLAQQQAEAGIDEAMKDDVELKSEKEFLEKLSTAQRATAKSVTIVVKKGTANIPAKTVTREILPESEEISDDEKFQEILQAEARGPSLTDGICLDGTKPTHEVFFEYFFPSLMGIAAKMDRFYKNPLSPGYNTVLERNIKFCDLTASD